MACPQPALSQGSSHPASGEVFQCLPSHTLLRTGRPSNKMPKMMRRRGQVPGVTLLASPLQTGNTEVAGSCLCPVQGIRQGGARLQTLVETFPTETTGLIFRSLVSTYAFKEGMTSVVEPHCQPRILTHMSTPWTPGTTKLKTYKESPLAQRPLALANSWKH